jgi:hypothetical protein
MCSYRFIFTTLQFFTAADTRLIGWLPQSGSTRVANTHFQSSKLSYAAVCHSFPQNLGTRNYWVSEPISSMFYVFCPSFFWPWVFVSLFYFYFNLLFSLHSFLCSSILQFPTINSDERPYKCIVLTDIRQAITRCFLRITSHLAPKNRKIRILS